MFSLLLVLTLSSSSAPVQHNKLECSRDGFGYLHCVEQEEQRPGALVVTGDERLQQVTKIKAMISAGNCKGARRYASRLHDPQVERATIEACGT